MCVPRLTRSLPSVNKAFDHQRLFDSHCTRNDEMSSPRQHHWAKNERCIFEMCVSLGINMFHCSIAEVLPLSCMGALRIWSALRLTWQSRNVFVFMMQWGNRKCHDIIFLCDQSHDLCSSDDWLEHFLWSPSEIPPQLSLRWMGMLKDSFHEVL